MKNLDVIIIGAPRSGTNMLRDILTSFDGVCTWPCDEINYIWRHGNVGYPSDEMPPSLVSRKVQKYIQEKFDHTREKYNSEIVVEKTCANTLRVPYVDAILPEAKYINIIRDGIDATGSAKLRWQSNVDLPYILKKARYVPVIDLPYYSARYLWSRFFKLISKEKRLAFWGPVLSDIDDLLQKHTLEEVCAIQWQRCVDSSDRALAAMAEGKVLHLRYEEFVAQPAIELEKVLQFLGVDASKEDIERAVAGVSDKSLGKGRAALGDETIKSLETLIGSTLERLGYK